MKQFELTIIRRDGDNFKIKSSDKIEADDLIQLLGQFMFVIVRMQRDLGVEEIQGVTDDDIPF